jgi:choline dehydrogenase
MEDNERGADQWRGQGGPMAVSEVRSRYPITDEWIEAVQQAGYPRSLDLNGESAEGVDHIQLSQRRGLRHSTAAGYLRRKPPTLDILTEAQVLKVETEGGRATGVTVRRGGEVTTMTAREGVVLCAGALNTPRLLMLSGIGPEKELRHHGIDVVCALAGVGSNLQEHPGVHLVNAVNARTLNDDSRGLSGVKQVLALVIARTGALTTGIGHAQAFVRSRDWLPAPNLQLAFSAFAFDVTDKGNLALRKESSVSTFVALMRPQSRGRISLRSADPNAPPKIEHLLLGDEGDVEQLIDGLEIARTIMAQPAIARHVKEEVRPGAELTTREALGHYVRGATIPMFHPVGTARMGAVGDPEAVVGPDCGVRGVGGLWVADASIMPTIPQGNTNATAFMIGERASDLILERLRRKAAA